MKPDLSHRFRQQAVSLVLFFAAVAAVFALAGLSKDPAKKQAEFVVQQLLSCSSAVEQAVDAAVPSGSQPGLPQWTPRACTPMFRRSWGMS